jgi:hypothetical protein
MRRWKITGGNGSMGASEPKDESQSHLRSTLDFSTNATGEAIRYKQARHRRKALLALIDELSVCSIAPTPTVGEEVAINKTHSPTLTVAVKRDAGWWRSRWMFGILPFNLWHDSARGSQRITWQTAPTPMGSGPGFYLSISLWSCDSIR